MRLTPENKALQGQYKKNIETQRHKVIKSENELKNIDKYYSKKTQDAKVRGERKVLDSQEEIDKRLLTQVQEQKARLTQLKSSIQNDQQKLLDQKRNINNLHSLEVADLDESLKEKSDFLHSRAQEYTKDSNEKVKNYTKDLDRKTDFDISVAKQESKRKLDSNTKNTKNLIQDQENKFQIKIENNERIYNKLENDQRKKYENEMKNNELKGSMLLETQRQNTEKNLQRFTKHRKKMVLNQEQSFTKNIDSLKKEHLEIIKNIKNNFDKEIKNLKASNAEFKKISTEKQADSFYSISKLKPEIIDLNEEKAYLVKIKVSDFEKENYRVTGNGRRIKISYTRSFSDRIENEKNKSINTSNRSEVASHELSVKDIINSKKVTQSYNDGVLQFKISKL